MILVSSPFALGSPACAFSRSLPRAWASSASWYSNPRDTKSSRDGSALQARSRRRESRQGDSDSVVGIGLRPHNQFKLARFRGERRCGLAGTPCFRPLSSSRCSTGHCSIEPSRDLPQPDEALLQDLRPSPASDARRPPAARPRRSPGGTGTTRSPSGPRRRHLGGQRRRTSRRRGPSAYRRPAPPDGGTRPTSASLGLRTVSRLRFDGV